MSTSTGAEVDRRHSATDGGNVTTIAAITAGCAFMAESVVSLVIDSHVGYHALNVVLNAALLVVAVSVARAGRARVGAAGVVGGWGTAVMALLAGAGGLWTLLAEGLASSGTPGVVDGIAHTAVMASILFMVPVGIGLRRSSSIAGTVIAVAAACIVAMILGDLDAPEVFLVPEAALGAGWFLYGRSMRTQPAATQRR